MTALETLQAPKAKRMSNDFAQRSRFEIDEPETPLEQFDRWSREATERHRQCGLPDESPLTTEEIVAIVKEVRGERYAEEQALANRI
jgi:hypothetical protein